MDKKEKKNHIKSCKVSPKRCPITIDSEHWKCSNDLGSYNSLLCVSADQRTRIVISCMELYERKFKGMNVKRKFMILDNLDNLGDSWKMYINPQDSSSFCAERSLSLENHSKNV